MQGNETFVNLEATTSLSAVIRTGVAKILKVLLLFTFVAINSDICSLQFAFCSIRVNSYASYTGVIEMVGVPF
ncbi:hypothetical protein JDS99_29585 [Bacillus cereus group sp. N6]|uniref:hypothetical protein n=1 Tax=Bacillus cereus group sp. N6 TaxID=2794583 RepID=UPI0018F5C8D8|nr:hypothetical protein [Bacillus cereus group sp. N6]MBJ8113683.1 hypothetical protein [Bacillus cereus group sp. N6]